MSNLTNNMGTYSPNFIRWLGKLLYLWIRSKVYPTNLRESLALDETKPVVYVLKTRSLRDLIVLEHHCRRGGLPRLEHTLSSLLMSKKGAAHIYLTKLGIIQQKRVKGLPTDLSLLVDFVATTQFEDVQLVPVSVFWGRDPGKEESSLLKLFFFDDEYGGVFQRFFTFLVHGRNVFCNFGKPISIKALLADELNREDSSKKLRRVLRVHYRSQRDIVMGPHLYDRAQVINSLVQSKRVRKIIVQEAKRRDVDVSVIEDKARSYADEVTSRPSPNVLRFLDIILTWLWRKLYDGVEVKNADRLREVAQESELVYVPSHRSHMDYLLLGYVLYYLGLMCPHTVAGINLNFWPIGSILRGGGAIFIRRTFGGDRLYSTIVSEFIHYLMTAGFPVGFYPEGGRSRTGRLLKPKLGILSMVVHSYRRNARKPVLLVPVYIGYDKVMELRSYTKELTGRKKTNESLGQFLKARKLLRSEFGKAYVSFGEPIDLGSFLKENGVEIEGGASELDDGEFKPLVPVIGQLAKEMMVRTNKSAVVNPTALFASILLASPKNAMEEEDLLRVAQLWLTLLERLPYSSDMTILVNKGNLREELNMAEKLSGFSRFASPTGDVVFLSEKDGAALAYYRNNIQHLLVLPATIAAAFTYSHSMSDADLAQLCADLYEFSKEEFFLYWTPDELRARIASYRDLLLEMGLLQRSPEGNLLQRPEAMASESFSLRMLGRVVSHDLDRYAVFTQLLAQSFSQGSVHRDAFEKQCLLVIQRMDLLFGKGTGDVLPYDSHMLRSFLEGLAHMGYIELRGDEIHLERPIVDLAKRFEVLLGMDVRQSLKRGSVV